jgi:hypothetical protein
MGLKKFYCPLLMTLMELRVKKWLKNQFPNVYSSVKDTLEICVNILAILCSSSFCFIIYRSQRLPNMLLCCNPVV